MSSDSEKGNGGVFRLSGRKNIHNHGTYCPFWKKDMGRYGLSSSSNKTQERAMCSTSHEGIDEVDNVVSKLVRASSPIATRRNEIRRNSLNSPKLLQQSYTDDSDEDGNLLSKSSPAILSPYSCCREEPEQANSKNYSYESTNSSSSQNNVNERGNSSLHNTPLQISQNSVRNVDRTNFKMHQSTAKGSNMVLVTIILIALISIVVAYYYSLFATNKDMSNIIYDKLNFYNDVIGVGSKYKINDNSILQVRAGIATIFERQDTGSFIFAYNSDRIDFNLVNFNNFVSELATAAARYLRNHTKTIQHVVVDTSNLRAHSDKELMNEYLEDVDKTGVMLVKDLDRVPSTLAMAFHYYCDEYNPLVKKSAIFFTLNMAKCSNVSSDRHTHQKIEKCLADKWEKMPQDNIRPLLNRVVNVVIDVTSDF